MIFPPMVLTALMQDEGFCAKPYKDTEGKTTLGYGRNLDDNPLTITEAKALLYNDVTRTVADLDRMIPWWRNLNEVRQSVLVNMAFNMGALKLIGFRKMIAALQAGDYATAAKEALDSKWAKQVGHRAVRLAEELRTGEIA